MEFLKYGFVYYKEILKEWEFWIDVINYLVGRNFDDRRLVFLILGEVMRI